jgi:RND family efflux transporter MFP subunit
MGSSLSDELASLRIERRGSNYGPGPKRDPGRPARRKSFGLGLLSMLLWMVPLALVGVGGYYAYKQYDRFKPKTEVKVVEIQMTTSAHAERKLTAKGYLRSLRQANIGPKVVGRVVEILVEEGSKVKKGQLLIVLEHNDLDAQLESRKAMMLRAKADIEEAKADLEYKKARGDRARRLEKKNMSVSTEELQQMTSALDMAVAHLLSLESSLKLQESQVREMEVSISNMNIVAPFDGTVIERPADLGEQVTTDKVLTLADLEHLDVETDVAENLLSKIVIGEPASISVSAVPNMHYRGRVRKIIPTSDRARGTVKVKVEILDPDEHLFPELAADVSFLPIKSTQGPDAGRVRPYLNMSAVVDPRGKPYVWRVDSQNKLEKVPVELVLINDELVRVESGLDAHVKVVDRPKPSLHEGEAVKVSD